jgi:hypothetical protein
MRRAPWSMSRRLVPDVGSVIVVAWTLPPIVVKIAESILKSNVDKEPGIYGGVQNLEIVNGFLVDRWPSSKSPWKREIS